MPNAVQLGDDLNAGIIGCGNISEAYLMLASQFNGYQIVAVADIDQSAADARAVAFNCRSLTVDALLADKSIELVVNLTVPNAHFEISKAALQAGKHVYSEKPYVLSIEEGLELRKVAAANGVRIGSAPDTFLGGSHQRARELVDSGAIGKVIGGSCYFQSHGMEGWHPQPDFFYQKGGGPILDMGAYYVSNLVQLLGPVKQVAAMSSKPYAQRTISSEPRAGETIDVEVQTTVNGILKFAQGAQITFAASWDVWASENNLIELHGTEKSMFLADPNHFGGEVRISDGTEEERYAPLASLSEPKFEDARGEMKANYRGIGLADMVAAIAEGREHRCNGDLALHVMDTLLSLLKSAESGQFESLSTTCTQPAAMSDEIARSFLTNG